MIRLPRARRGKWVYQDGQPAAHAGRQLHLVRPWQTHRVFGWFSIYTLPFSRKVSLKSGYFQLSVLLSGFPKSRGEGRLALCVCRTATRALPLHLPTYSPRCRNKDTPRRSPEAGGFFLSRGSQSGLGGNPGASSCPAHPPAWAADVEEWGGGPKQTCLCRRGDATWRQGCGEAATRLGAPEAEAAEAAQPCPQLIAGSLR